MLYWEFIAGHEKDKQIADLFKLNNIRRYNESLISQIELSLILGVPEHFGCYALTMKKKSFKNCERNQ